MADRLSRLFKAKLLRRSSSPTVSQQKKAGSRAVDPSTSTSTTTPNTTAKSTRLCSPSENAVSSPLFLSSSPVDVSAANSRAYSVVSSLPLDHPSSPDEVLAGPATPATGCSSSDQGHHPYHYSSQQLRNLEQQSQYCDPIETTPASTSVKKVRVEDAVGKGSEQQKKKRAERPGDSLEPSPTTTNITTTTGSGTNTTAHRWQPLEQRRNTVQPSSSPCPSPSPLPSFSDPFGGVLLQSPKVREREHQQRRGIQTSNTTATGDPLAPVSESPPSDEKPNNHPAPPSAVFPKRPSLAIRRQSLLPPSHQHLVTNILDPGLLFPNNAPASAHSAPATVEMPPRKIWVRRPGGSPTLVPILEDAMVDELRDQVIVKYTNSLGKTFDSPDIVIRIFPRNGSNKPSTQERILNPEESLAAVVDAYYPGGQRVEEALVIDIPARRTPKPSPRPVYYHHSDPVEPGDYFSIVPMGANVSTPPTHTSSSSAGNNHQTPSISILTTGKAPPLPSPGTARANRHARRPPAIRHSTNSPTTLGQAPTKEIVTSPSAQNQPTPQVPTPPGPPPPESPQTKTVSPPTRGSSPRPRPSVNEKKPSNTSPLLGAAFGGLIEGTVPPINVLIVEDNIINQKLLEAFMKRLSVRWKCAGNGEEAVKKWRQGGFHLVLMDIQLPVMNGLDATKEIRRLERLNGIGVFPNDGRSSATTANALSLNGEHEHETSGSITEEDTLQDRSLFKSPVIIVALTASSLQSDRHEALAAGCNDFLTKPVGFPWLEQKVTEWGCMQALIDFEGWRKWRGFMDDPLPTPVTDGHASPMHMSSTVNKPPSPSSPSSVRSPSKHGSINIEGPPFPDRPDMPREDSGSGSDQMQDQDGSVGGQ